MDITFNPGTGTDGAVHTILYNSQDQKAIIGGRFTTYNGVNRWRIAKIVMGGGENSGIVEFLLMSAPVP